MAEHYDREHLSWLVQTVDQMMQTKTAATIEEACGSLVAEWKTKTGRDVTGKCLIGIYYRHKKRTVPPMEGTYELPEGHVIVVVENGKSFAQVYQDMETAIRSVNGKLSEFSFYEGSKLQVGLKTVTVVQKL